MWSKDVASVVFEANGGGLFPTASRIMKTKAKTYNELNLNPLMTLLGRYYQIRDDYQDVFFRRRTLIRHHSYFKLNLKQNS